MKLPPTKKWPSPHLLKNWAPSKKWFLEKIQILKTIVNICVSFINQNLKLQDSLWFTFILAYYDRGPLAQQKNNIFHSTHHYTSNDIFDFLGSSLSFFKELQIVHGFGVSNKWRREERCVEKNFGQKIGVGLK